MVRSIFFACAAALALGAPAFAQTDQSQPPSALTVAPSALGPSALAAAPSALGAPAGAVSELCGVFYVEPERGIYVPIQGYSVMAATPPLTAPPNQPRIDAIVCERAGLSISPNDYRVLTDLHVPLFIRAGERTVAMELDRTGVHLRFTNGAPLPEEMQGLRDALDRANDDIARMSAPG